MNSVDVARANAEIAYRDRRDRFALAALPGVIARFPDAVVGQPDRLSLAREAYAFADAMLIASVWSEAGEARDEPEGS